MWGWILFRAPTKLGPALVWLLSVQPVCVQLSESIWWWSSNDNWINTSSHVDSQLGAASLLSQDTELQSRRRHHQSHPPAAETTSLTTPLAHFIF